MDELGTLTMSVKELNRLEILGRALERRLTQAAEQLGLSLRQVERFVGSFVSMAAKASFRRSEEGRVTGSCPQGFVSAPCRSCGHASRTSVRPLAAEKLSEQRGLLVSTETRRRWMIEVELWVPRSRRMRRVHQPRHRRSCFGELIQIDGCDHERFEDRAPRCTLLVYVDDATSRLMELCFVKSESTFDFF